MPTFSVVVTCHQRPEIADTLRANAPLLERHGAEVTLVDCGPDPDEAPAAGDVPVSMLRHVVVPAPAFNSSLAKNIGAHSSAGRFLFFLDADIVLCSDVLAEARVVLARRRCVLQVRTVRESDPQDAGAVDGVSEVVDTRELTFRDGRRARLRFIRSAEGTRCGSGLLLVRRRDFVAAGGFNSTLDGWGFEDLDLQIRLQAAAGLSLREVGTVLHLTHGDDKRNIRSGSRQADNTRNTRACFENYARGQYHGSYLADVERWRSSIRRVDVARGRRHGDERAGPERQSQPTGFSPGAP